jgi:hypothetical protein
LQNDVCASEEQDPFRTFGAFVEALSERHVPRALETSPSDQQSSQAPLSALRTQ